HPDDWHLRYNYATRLYQLKRYAEAADHIDVVVARFPNRPHFRLCLAHALAQSGRTDQAIAQYRRILEQHPHFEAARTALGHMLNPTGKPVGSRLSD
ncbi:MAG: tetratricopeptide repeat protein, partial [Halothiobacillaceae bacterium]